MIWAPSSEKNAEALLRKHGSFWQRTSLQYKEVFQAGQRVLAFYTGDVGRGQVPCIYSHPKPHDPVVLDPLNLLMTNP